MTTIGTSTAAFYERSGIDMAALRARSEELQKQMGRGERLARSSDDPVAASRLRHLGRAERLSAIDETNADRATADLSLADAALTSFADGIARAQELATLAANGTLNAGQRASIGTELEHLHGTLLGLANARDSAGHALFGGEAVGAAYAVDAAGGAVYLGTAGTGDLSLGEGQSVTRGITGPEFLTFKVNGNDTDLLSVVAGLASALQGTSGDPAGAARDALGALDTGMESVTTAQTIVGARLGWIDLTTERRTNLGELRADEQAKIGGTDIAKTVVDLQNTMLVLEASQASFARLASLSLFDQLR